MAASTSVPDDLVLVGHVSGAYGVVGWIKIRPYSTDADALLQIKTWWLDKPELHDLDVLQVRRQGDDVVAQLVGIAGRDAAEALQGATVQVRRSHFPALAQGEFYWLDLIGLEVENLQGQHLGRVSDLMDNGVHPVLRVAVTGGAEGVVSPSAELLIPFVEQYIITVDPAAGKITADWGLDY